MKGLQSGLKGALEGLHKDGVTLIGAGKRKDAHSALVVGSARTPVGLWFWDLEAELEGFGILLWFLRAIFGV